MPKPEVDLHLQRVAKGGFSESAGVFTITGSMDERRLLELIDQSRQDGHRVVLESGVLKIRPGRA